MTETTEKRVPPYVSFTTLLAQIERMEKESVPSEIDKHFLVGMAGGTQNHFRHAMRSLGFIDDNNRSTDLLRAVAKQPEKRKELFGQILRDRFPELVDLPTDAAKSEYERVLDDYGASATDTKRKALTFYVAAAEYAGIPVSTFVKSGRRGPTGPRRPSTRRKSTRNGGEEAAAPAPTPPAMKLSDEEMRAAYFHLLLKKAEGDDADEMLDRIELLLGIDPEKRKNRGRKTAGSKPATPTDLASPAEE